MNVVQRIDVNQGKPLASRFSSLTLITFSFSLFDLLTVTAISWFFFSSSSKRIQVTDFILISAKTSLIGCSAGFCSRNQVIGRMLTFLVFGCC